MNQHRKQIHQVLRQHHPGAVRKAKKLFRFKYPKLLLLGIMIILSYIIFSNETIAEQIGELGELGYLGTFIAGILSPFGFTAPISIGILIELEIENIWLGTIIGGLGAMLGDLIIFKTIKFSFMDEFKQLEKTGAIKKIEKIVKNSKHVLINHYLLYIFAGIILTTPLPDELGVSMLAGLTTIKPLRFMIISFVLHSLAIFLLLFI